MSSAGSARRFFSPGLGGLSDEVRPSINVGARLAVAAGDATSPCAPSCAATLTLVNSSGQFFCSGGCVVSIRGTTLGQAEAMVGVSIGF